METMTLEELRVACINAAIRERDELRAEVARLNDVFARANHRTSVAEAELAGLKARMKPCAQVVGGEVRALMDPDDEGKYVAVMVVEE